MHLSFKIKYFRPVGHISGNRSFPCSKLLLPQKRSVLSNNTATSYGKEDKGRTQDPECLYLDAMRQFLGITPFNLPPEQTLKAGEYWSKNFFSASLAPGFRDLHCLTLPGVVNFLRILCGMRIQLKELAANMIALLHQEYITNYKEVDMKYVLQIIKAASFLDLKLEPDIVKWLFNTLLWQMDKIPISEIPLIILSILTWNEINLMNFNECIPPLPRVSTEKMNAAEESLSACGSYEKSSYSGEKSHIFAEDLKAAVLPCFDMIGCSVKNHCSNLTEGEKFDLDLIVLRLIYRCVHESSSLNNHGAVNVLKDILWILENEVLICCSGERILQHSHIYSFFKVIQSTPPSRDLYTCKSSLLKKVQESLKLLGCAYSSKYTGHLFLPVVLEGTNIVVNCVEQNDTYLYSDDFVPLAKLKYSQLIRGGWHVCSLKDSCFTNDLSDIIRREISDAYLMKVTLKARPSWKYALRNIYITGIKPNISAR